MSLRALTSLIILGLIDSFQFLNFSLDTLAKNLRKIFFK